MEEEAEKLLDELEIEIEELTPDDFTDIFEQPEVPDSVKQKFFNKFIDKKRQTMVNKIKPKAKKDLVRLASPQVSVDGDFKFIFNGDMLGMKFLQQQNVVLAT